MRIVKFATAAALVFAGVSSTTVNVMAQQSTTSLPEKCRHAQAKSMGGMEHMQKPDMSGMDEAQQAYMQSMMKMGPAMMQGMMARDADVAFVCGMIAHHQGAIDMAEVELKHGDNEQAKQMAQKVIDAQKKEIVEFTQWIDANAK